MDLKDYKELKADAQAILTSKRSEYSVSELDVIELIEKGNKYNTDILTQVSTIREYIKQREIELDRLPLEDICQLESSRNHTIDLFENANIFREETRKCYEENISALENKYINANVELRLKEIEKESYGNKYLDPGKRDAYGRYHIPHDQISEIFEKMPKFEEELRALRKAIIETLKDLDHNKSKAKEEDESLRLERDNLERTIQDIAAKIESFGYIADKRKELSEDITNFERQIVKIKLNINSFEKMIKDRQKRLHTLLSDANRSQLRIDEIQHKIDEIKGREETNE